MINVLFAGNPDDWPIYEPALKDAFTAAGLEVDLRRDFPPETIDYVIYAPSSTLQDFTPLTRCKAVLNLWAGVEKAVGNETLTQPFARMVGGGLTEGMVEWVTGHVLRHHLGMDAHIVNPDKVWDDTPPPLACERDIAILGLGALGTACGDMLRQVGFRVRGWSRRPKTVDGIACFHGAEGLTEALSGAHGVVLLLPDTPATRNILNDETLALLAPGAFVLNPGRGPLIDDEALLSALDSGHVSHATLDVFRKEPLPGDDPYWTDPKVTVTPHIASTTRPRQAAEVIAENIARGEAGQPFLHLVDRDAGY